MTKLVIGMAAVLAVLCTGLGLWLLDVLKKTEQGFAAPVGAAVLLAMLQLLYYPIQILHGSFYAIAGVSIAVLLFALFCTLKRFKRVVHNLLRPQTLMVLIGFLAFLFVFYNSSLELEYSDSPMYLNYISQNIEAEHINLFNLYTGKTGAEWDGLYLYQGYYHFGSFLCWFINLQPFVQIDTIVTSAWGLGSLCSLISLMFYCNMIDSFKIGSKPLKYTLYIFTFFFTNLYYWRVVFSFYGNTWRTLFITMMMFYIYQWLKTDRKSSIRYIIPILGFAGIACSSSFLFISFIVLFSLAAYLFYIKQENTLKDMSIFVIPLVIYACVYVARSSLAAGIIAVIVFTVYYAVLLYQRTIHLLSPIEAFFFRYARLIFFILIPLAAALLSLYVNLFDKSFLYGYSYYFNDHQKYDMVKDYLFIHSEWYDNIINVIRWAGVILILCKAKAKEERYIKVTMILMLILFMNPLCTTAIAYTIASNVFYRSVEVLFNPFTETMIIVYLYRYFSKKKVLQGGLMACLLVSTAGGNIESWQGDKGGLYGNYITEGEDENHIYKVDEDELEAIRFLQNELEGWQEDRQPVVISQAEGTRVFLPQVYQLITARDTYYQYTRIDEELYQIARRHHDWEEKTDIDYSNTCSLLDTYDVDYLVIRYFENPEFDQATDACSVTLLTGARIKVKKVQK